MAERDHGIVLRWIYDIPGEAGLDSADATLGYALEHGPSTLVGFGLGGPEVPRPQFAPHFDRARAAGLRSLPHAGESTDAQSVWDALDALGAERIGHGIRAVDDPALVERLVAERIPLEVCPTSNIATRCVERLEDHPIRALRDAGVVVTVNSDDPPMFGTTLNREYAIAADLLDLDEDGLADLARTAVDVSYAPDDVKRRVRGEISGVRRRATAGAVGADGRLAVEPEPIGVCRPVTTGTADTDPRTGADRPRGRPGRAGAGEGHRRRRTADVGAVVDAVDAERAGEPGGTAGPVALARPRSRRRRRRRARRRPRRRAAARPAPRPRRRRRRWRTSACRS